MERLLGTKTSQADSRLLRELFLQELPADVPVVIASNAESSSLSSAVRRRGDGSGSAVHRSGAHTCR
ncbi:hypothetical protein HPB50_004405 [Hyalomma asiaticum]|uniref:Uncharacterized protein n=1 Tax=Hyalomma asiaticum TaxID=266040 RepID=A0ACB7RME7_HYAAI|nr:hypothetical protein HPB50_004405 [Hyalomma asiaticum]